MSREKAVRKTKKNKNKNPLKLPLIIGLLFIVLIAFNSGIKENVLRVPGIKKIRQYLVEFHIHFQIKICITKY